MKHLLVAVSAHGFGHFAQTASVIEALWRRLPDLRVTLRTTLPEPLLHSRLNRPFTLIRETTDFGMVMDSALDVRREDSARAYQAFHAEWEARLEAEAASLRAIAPDLILANVPYLTLAAAERVGIPAIALCSLNWADVYRHYCGERPEAERIHGQMLAAYRSARWFLQPEPSMPMLDLPNRRAIGPLARLGRNRRDELSRRLGLSREERLVLVATGGIDTRLPIEQWPRQDGVRWLVPAAWQVERDDVLSHEQGISFTDLLCSCDVLLTKPGYGSFAEAACNGVPVLYVPRGDWPEEPFITPWLAHRGRALAVDRERLFRGDLVAPIEHLLAQPAPPPVAPSGADEAAEIVASLLV